MGGDLIVILPVCDLALEVRLHGEHLGVCAAVAVPFERADCCGIGWSRRSIGLVQQRPEMKRCHHNIGLRIAPK
jgi:hypothetical protein